MSIHASALALVVAAFGTLACSSSVEPRGGSAGAPSGGLSAGGEASGAGAAGAGSGGQVDAGGGGSGHGGGGGADGSRGGSGGVGGGGASGGGVTAGGAASGAGGAGGGEVPSGGTGGDGSGAAGAGGSAAAPRFVHPGLLLTTADLARTRAKVASGVQPWAGSFAKLKVDAQSSAERVVAAPVAIIGRNSASAYAGTRYGAEDAAATAFQNALVYVIEGDAAHARKAVEILNACASTTQHFDTKDPERDLEAAILAWLWVSTAELIRYSDFTGWSADEIKRFDTWIFDVVYADTAYDPHGVLITPPANGAGARGAFALRTKLAIGVYLDDRAIYDQAVDYFFHGQGNGAPSYYVLPSTGETWEAGRDQGHAQGGLSRLVETAQIAFNQGNSELYAWENNALLRAVEYIAAYNTGNEVPYQLMVPYTLDWAGTYDKISATDRGNLATIYELPYSYYVSTLGLAMPRAKVAIEREVVEEFTPQNDNPFFATLFYRR